MEIGTALSIVMILWAGDLVIGAPCSGPALEWAFGGRFRVFTFIKIETIYKTLFSRGVVRQKLPWSFWLLLDK